jgi:hypothetical protein
MLFLLLIILVVVEIVTSEGNHRSRHALEADELAWIARYYKWENNSAKRTCETAATSRPTARWLPRPSSCAPSRGLRGRLVAETSLGHGPDRAVRAKLLLSRRLPQASGVLTDSHIDPKLGRVASKLAERKVQTRC